MSVALVVEIIGDASKLAGSLDSAGKSAGGFGGALGGNLLQVTALAGAAGIAAGAIASMTMAAADDRDEQNKLAAAVKAAGAETSTSNDQIEQAIALGQEKAFTDSQTRDALTSLITATGDVTTATDALTKAQDIARFANVDLATAADAVAKAQAGQAGPLTKLLPGLTKNTDATVILAEATAAAAGQADLYSTSAQGMQDRAGDAFGELGEEIGSVFLPILDALLPAILAIVKAFGTLVHAVLPLLVPVLKLIGAALTIVANALATVIGWLVKLITWVGTAVGKLGDFLAAINPLKGISLPSLPFLNSTGASGPAAVGFGRSGVPTQTVAAAPQIVVYTTGDGIEAEQAIVRALRRTTRINGGVIPALGWAPTS